MSQLVGSRPRGLLDWIFRPCKSPWTLAEGVGPFLRDLRRCTAQAMGRVLSYLHGVEATLGAAALDTPKRGKGNSVAIKNGTESRQRLWDYWKITPLGLFPPHPWDAGGNDISALQGRSPEVFKWERCSWIWDAPWGCESLNLVLLNPKCLLSPRGIFPLGRVSPQVSVWSTQCDSLSERCKSAESPKPLPQALVRSAQRSKIFLTVFSLKSGFASNESVLGSDRILRGEKV